jgi:hypothetical protein
MNRNEIFKVLRECNVPEVLVIELRIAMGAKRSITICATVTRIIDQYNDTPERESIVTSCLESLLRIHFK